MDGDTANLYNVIVSTKDTGRFIQAINDFNLYASSLLLLELGYELLRSRGLGMRRPQIDKRAFQFVHHDTTFAFKMENNEATLTIIGDAYTETQKKYLRELYRTNVLIDGIETGIPLDRTFSYMVNLLYSFPVHLIKLLIDAIVDVNSSKRKVIRLMLCAPLRTQDKTSEILQALQLPKRIEFAMKQPMDEVLQPSSRLTYLEKTPEGFTCFYVVIRIRDKHTDQYADLPIRIYAIPNKITVSIQMWKEAMRDVRDNPAIGQDLLQTVNEDDPMNIDQELDDNVIRRLLKALSRLDIEEVLSL